MPVDTRAVAVSLAVNGAICILSVTIFSTLRMIKYLKRFYMPKWFHTADPDTRQSRPLRIGRWPWSWVVSVLKHREARLIAVAGLDGAVYIRIITFGLHLFCCLSLWCLAVVLPVNLAGKEVDKIIEEQKSKEPPPSPHPDMGPFGPGGNISDQVARYRFSDIDRLSMSNIHSGSPILWVHLASVYVVTLIVLWLLWKYNKEVVELRVVHLGRARQRGLARTILVTDIPGMPYGTFLESCVRLVNESLLRFLPLSIKRRIERAAQEAREATEQGLSIVTSNVASALTQSLLQSPDTEAGMEELQSLEELTDQQLLEARKKMDTWNEAKKKLARGMTPEEMVEEEFGYMYSPEAIRAVHMALDERFCGPLLAQYEANKMLLEDYIDLYQGMLDKGKKPKKLKKIRVVGALYGPWGIQQYGTTPKRVDAVQACTALLRHLAEQIAKLQAEVDTDLNVPAAFVTFNSRWHQAIGSTALHFHDETCWRCQGAPGPQEVIWANLGTRLWEKRLRRTAVWAAFYLLLLFYLVPVTAIQGLLQIERLQQVPIVALLLKMPFVRSILVGILPGLALRLFLLLLPYLLWSLNISAGAVSLSQVDFAVVDQYFGFQVVIVFLASFVIGTLANQITQLLKHPDTILRVLGVSTPQTVSFFIIYILFNGLTVQPLQFLRLGQLLVFLLRYGLAATTRARLRVEKPQVQFFGTYVADHSITLLLGLVFCVINPLVLPACLLYFLLQWPLQCYQQLYVMDRPYDSGGRIWAQVFGHIMTSLYVFQLVMAALLSIKEFPFVPLLLLPLGLAAFFHTNMNSLFRRPLSVLSLHDAAMQDDQDQAQQGGSTSAPPRPHQDDDQQLVRLYQHPVLKIDLAELEKLLQEADSVYDAVRGFVKADTAQQAPHAGMEPHGEAEGGDGRDGGPNGGSRAWYKTRDASQARDAGAGTSKLQPAVLDTGAGGNPSGRITAAGSTGGGTSGAENIARGFADSGNTGVGNNTGGLVGGGQTVSRGLASPTKGKKMKKTVSFENAPQFFGGGDLADQGPAAAAPAGRGGSGVGSDSGAASNGVVWSLNSDAQLPETWSADEQDLEGLSQEGPVAGGARGESNQAQGIRLQGAEAGTGVAVGEGLDWQHEPALSGVPISEALMAGGMLVPAIQVLLGSHDIDVPDLLRDSSSNLLEVRSESQELAGHVGHLGQHVLGLCRPQSPVGQPVCQPGGQQGRYGGYSLRKDSSSMSSGQTDIESPQAEVAEVVSSPSPAFCTPTAERDNGVRTDAPRLPRQSSGKSQFSKVRRLSGSLRSSVDGADQLSQPNPASQQNPFVAVEKQARSPSYSSKDKDGMRNGGIEGDLPTPGPLFAGLSNAAAGPRSFAPTSFGSASVASSERDSYRGDSGWLAAGVQTPPFSHSAYIQASNSFTDSLDSNLAGEPGVDLVATPERNPAKTGEGGTRPWTSDELLPNLGSMTAVAQGGRRTLRNDPVKNSSIESLSAAGPAQRYGIVQDSDIALRRSYDFGRALAAVRRTDPGSAPYHGGSSAAVDGSTGRGTGGFAAAVAASGGGAGAGCTAAPAGAEPLDAGEPSRAAQGNVCTPAGAADEFAHRTASLSAAQRGLERTFLPVFRQPQVSPEPPSKP